MKTEQKKIIEKREHGRAAPSPAARYDSQQYSKSPEFLNRSLIGNFLRTLKYQIRLSAIFSKSEILSSEQISSSPYSVLFTNLAFYRQPIQPTFRLIVITRGVYSRLQE